MRNDNGMLIIVLILAITLMLVLYWLGIVSEWKIAVLTITSAVYSVIDAVIESINLTNRIKQVQLFADNLKKPKEDQSNEIRESMKPENYYKDNKWSKYLRWLPFILLIIGLSIERQEVSSKITNSISALSILLALLALYRKHYISSGLEQIETKLIDLQKSNTR